MEEIKQLVEDIKDELHGAKHYAKRAMHEKAEGEKAKADKYAMMAEQELKHADELHAMVVAEIAEYRKEHGEPPENMKAIWEMEHKKVIEKANKIKMMLGVYRQG